MSEQFTPGPWQVLAESDYSIIHVHEEQGGSFSSIATASFDLLGGDTEANAHLIAAAPELYAACERAQDLIEAWMNGLIKQVGIEWESPDEHPPALRLIRAALAKARGES